MPVWMQRMAVDRGRVGADRSGLRPPRNGLRQGGQEPEGLARPLAASPRFPGMR